VAKVKLSHKDYDDLVSSMRETVTILAKLKKDGIIDFKGTYIRTENRYEVLRKKYEAVEGC